MQEKAKRIVNKTITFIGSRYFFWGVIGFFALQAMWVVFSFRYPGIYDEYFHFGVIRVFTDHWWPVIYNQSQSYDAYRDFAGEGSKLFHYILSFPVRLFDVLNINMSAQIILLRVINVAMVGLGLVYFAKLFDRLKIKHIYTNVALLVFSLLPLTTLVAATINYDNALFLITPVFLLLLVDIYQSKNVSVLKLIYLTLLGMIACLIKFTYLPVFMVVGFIVLFTLIKRHKKELWHRLVKSARKINKIKGLLLVMCLMLLAVLFIQTYVVNTVKYGTPRPTCQQTLGTQRCLANGVIQRNEQLLQTKDERVMQDLPGFSITWSKVMLQKIFISGTNISSGAPSIKLSPLLFQTVVSLLIIAGAVVTLYAWRSLRFSPEVKIIATIVAVYVAVVFLESLRLYQTYNQPVAIQSRYFLIFAPVVIVIMVMATSFVLERFRAMKLLVLITVLLLFTQGGGVLTHILASEDSWYWDNPIVIEVNNTAKNILSPLAKPTHN